MGRAPSLAGWRRPPHRWRRPPRRRMCVVLHESTTGRQVLHGSTTGRRPWPPSRWRRRVGVEEPRAGGGGRAGWRRHAVVEEAALAPDFGERSAPPRVEEARPGGGGRAGWRRPRRVEEVARHRG
ncbi:unnamed protein product [Miscanthus lutarioriparius]|uniref:Uncharacterized protein n=1 Tax=Miscanthus lutarioriparius TaxID=422564 RepID=A0A811PVC4_9POAL|nr:unnamed protein product [Miscanthus lutarioriparius]